ncbi:universal stress protein [Aureibaculum marinum]|uniref:Universal stress protein n=1 Tax=Aureibaculum marinum TaxID=2487930 RepID=A0A3N4NWR6_9FLAO|nr:universal stress protein [Aureibaculum marinum]RPD98708.1 universal stress protein [Aureibaculum marinum]
MRKRFILLVDFSEYSTNLIKYAYDWSKEANATILLHHQTTAFLPAFADNEAKQELTQHANNDALQKLQLLVKKLIPNTVEISYSVSEIDFYHTLPNLLAEPYENLIFVGLKGTGLLKKIFLGSVALEIIRNTDNIIVAMPKEIDTYSHEKIYIAVSQNKPLNILELKKFFKFIDNRNTNITFFYLAKPNENTIAINKQLHDLSEMFSENFNTNYTVYKGDNPLEDMKNVINNNIEELLIVQKGSRLLTDQLFRNFLINELVFTGQTPLVVLP